MNFTQFLLLCLERGIINNLYGLEVYFSYKEAAKTKDDEGNEIDGLLDQEKFHYAVILLSK